MAFKGLPASSLQKQRRRWERLELILCSLISEDVSLLQRIETAHTLAETLVMSSALQSSHQGSSGLLGRKHLARGIERVFMGLTWCLQGALHSQRIRFRTVVISLLAMWPRESCSIPLTRTKSFVCRCMGVHFLKHLAQM